MTVFDTTRRDLAVLRDCVMVPAPWNRITGGDTVRGRDGLNWHVVKVEKHYATALVRLQHAQREAVVEVQLDDAVHVLDDSTGVRFTEHEGGVPVRQRKGAKRGDL